MMIFSNEQLFLGQNWANESLGADGENGTSTHYYIMHAYRARARNEQKSSKVGLTINDLTLLFCLTSHDVC